MATVPTGEAGYIEIVDDGSAVHFYVGGGYPSTNFGSCSWWGSVNGVGVGGTFGYPAGAGRVWIASYVAYGSQTVSFGIGDTGTSGMGGPTSMSLFVSRATRPNPPRVTGTDCGLDMISRTGMRFRFRWNGDGGSPITSYAYQCSTRADFADVGWAAAPNSGDLIRSDLVPGATYYWRVRAQNAVGVSDPSATISAATLPAGFLGGKSGAFVPFPTQVGKSNAFPDTQIFVGKGGTFVPLT